MESIQRSGCPVEFIIMSPMLRLAALALLGLSVLLLAIDAPGPTWRELWFLGLILLGTIVTRSLHVGSAVSAFGLGLGIVTMLMVGAGRALTAMGIDTSSGVANWGLIPVLEESLKLTPVAVVAWLHRRRSGLTPNPSDLLMLGCFAGAGFALAENALLVGDNAAVARDMARQYGPHIGPFYLVPGAWGAAGYVGHAAATGLICASVGLGVALRTRLGTSWWMVPAAGFAWVVVEHVLTNYYVGSGASAALMLGNGRLTPWLFMIVALAIVILDGRRGRSVLMHSATLRRRIGAARAAVLRRTRPLPRSSLAAWTLFMMQLRAINATAWFVRARLAERKTP